MFTKLILSSIITCFLVGCGSSQEQKNAEAMAIKQGAEIFLTEDGGEFEMYAELYSRERRWAESDMRRTNLVNSKNKEEAYVLLTGKMSQGSWVMLRKEKFGMLVCQ